MTFYWFDYTKKVMQMSRGILRVGLLQTDMCFVMTNSSMLASFG